MPHRCEWPDGDDPLMLSYHDEEWRTPGDLPSETRESKAMSSDLKRRGFRFIGTTVCYSFMQAAGLVNDHVTTCFRYRDLSRRYPGGPRRSTDTSVGS